MIKKRVKNTKKACLATVTVAEVLSEGRQKLLPGMKRIMQRKRKSNK